MPKRALRAGLYDRASTGPKDSETSKSVARQNRGNRKAADDNGWIVTSRYSDPGLSASRFAKAGRPEWERLREDVRRGMLDVIVFWEPSRGGRELEEWSSFLNDCMDRGVLIHITRDDQTYDVQKARDWRDLAREGVDSVSESNRLSDRIRDGVADAAKLGVPFGKIPYGYTRRYEGSGRLRKVIQKPDDKTAPIAREIIERIARSVPVSRIVNDLADQQIPSPAGGPRWDRMTVSRLVLNGVVYIGKRRHNGGPLLDGDWPPLIDEETYWKAVAVLSDPKRRTNAGSGIRPGSAKYLLSYIAKCDTCGGPLSVTTHYSTVEPYYRCAAGRAGCAYAPMEWMDRALTAAVVKICSEPGVFYGITSGDDAAAQAARDEATAERARLEEFKDQAIRGRLSASAFREVIRAIEKRIDELEERAASLSTDPALRDLVRGPEEARWQEIWDRWKGMPIPARRSVVSRLFSIRLIPVSKSHGLRDPFRIKVDGKFQA
jgi:DNA invertase Pin-like site-specific DNA recombinase